MLEKLIVIHLNYNYLMILMDHKKFMKNYSEKEMLELLIFIYFFLL